ncbi:molybdate ABC transporter substrate-binding protein [Georgenia wangjunii]|uniref:molybdate ABC transporter substrate-binding protein n=1 Tax=Georgenia wangjunii TaxID=3117730 RepID=UPI002F26C571
MSAAAPGPARTPHTRTVAGRVCRAGAVVVLLAALLAGCAAQAQGLTVFAAASLHGVLTERADDAEERLGVDVALSFAGSSDLVSQVDAGAPADILVTADARTMSRAADTGLLDGDAVAVATNHLVLVTPADNPAGVTGLDTSLAGATLVVCAPQVPCGAAAVELAAANGVTLAPVSEEPSVTAVLSKVTTGEADAALVYASDAASAGPAVVTFPVAGAERVVNTYLAAVVAGTEVPRAARAWIDWLAGPDGAAALADAGFGPP